jgi:hypothetical protein
VKTIDAVTLNAMPAVESELRKLQQETNSRQLKPAGEVSG